MGLLLFGLVWFGLGWVGLVCFGLVRFGLVWVGLEAPRRLQGLPAPSGLNARISDAVFSIGGGHRSVHSDGRLKTPARPQEPSGANNMSATCVSLQKRIRAMLNSRFVY